MLQIPNKVVHFIKLYALLVVSCAFSFQTYGQHHQALWNRIASCFHPPVYLKNSYGNYRPLLRFYNGDTVLTKRAWKQRRAEIANTWNQMMGPWPPLIRTQKMEVLDTVRRTGFTQYRIRFNWTSTEKTIAYLCVPGLKGRLPAVITTFYEPETAIGKGKPNRDFAFQLAKRGYVTLSLGTAEASKAGTYSVYYPSVENATVAPLSMLAYTAANAWYLLSGLPYVDDRRIGIMGHSFGGKWAMFASCLFDKFACAVWSDPGVVFDDTRGSAVNYWEPWYLGYYPPPWKDAWRKRGNTADAKGLYPKLIREGYDLHEIMALMAPRPFLVSGGSSDPVDRWTALNQVVRVNSLLGYTSRVAMTNRPGHDPNDESNEIAYLFFDYFLKK
ncbi:prolyl oligopeptidase family serine peptidase [Niabella sp. CC-SYL272]|uniref:prolyl oligopeptidase family serine peptidase n=1 Tax=Niabella agricola TaxID=2891571 RepID=UPI001F44F660|nr:prolyl oligopeptidase family serine peptidase [Niabella agricola]MCF3109981.1 prolyl oligopeptidase family serine peptidase [Niabella agricola]